MNKLLLRGIDTDQVLYKDVEDIILGYVTEMDTQENKRIMLTQFKLITVYVLKETIGLPMKMPYIHNPPRTTLIKPPYRSPQARCQRYILETLRSWIEDQHTYCIETMQELYYFSHFVQEFDQESVFQFLRHHTLHIAKKGAPLRMLFGEYPMGRRGLIYWSIV